MLVSFFPSSSGPVIIVIRACKYIASGIGRVASNVPEEKNVILVIFGGAVLTRAHYA